jgi:preprotein translocase subunit YajC
MALYIPIYRKLKYSEDIILTRSLPARGDLVVKQSEPVVPFTKIGRAKVSKERWKLEDGVRLARGIEDNSLIYQGEVVGRKFLRKFKAPYSGTIKKQDDGYYLYQEERDVWILSGLWGTIESVTEARNVNIKTQSVDVNFVAFTPQEVMGELIVFPNPSELLDIEYLQNFAKNTLNKVIYVGNHIRKQVVDKAIELKVTALIGGSIDWQVFKHAQHHGLPVALTTGFGKLETPEFIFNFLKSVSNRHVFVDGKAGLLRVPMPPDTDTFNNYRAEGSALREVKKGLIVIIYERDYFGMTGIVEDVQNEVIHVKLDKSSETVLVQIPNIFALI